MSIAGCSTECHGMTARPIQVGIQNGQVRDAPVNGENSPRRRIQLSSVLVQGQGQEHPSASRSLAESAAGVPLPLEMWPEQTDRATAGRESPLRGHDAEFKIIRRAASSLCAGRVGGGMVVFWGAQCRSPHRWRSAWRQWKIVGKSVTGPTPPEKAYSGRFILRTNRDVHCGAALAAGLKAPALRCVRSDRQRPS